MMAYCVEGGPELQQLVVGQLAMRGVEDAYGYFPREINKIATEVSERKLYCLSYAIDVHTSYYCARILVAFSPHPGAAVPLTALQMPRVAGPVGGAAAPVQGTQAAQDCTTHQVIHGYIGVSTNCLCASSC